MNKTRRPRVLIFVGVYYPGFMAGGPLRSISNLVDNLHDEVEFRIVTSDRDLKATQPYPGLPLNQWLRVGNAEVFYLPPDEQNVFSISRLLRNTHYDVLYLNSFFDRRFSILPLLALRLGLAPRKQVLLAPRGEFSPGALTLKKRRKRAFLAFSKWLGLHSGILWHASTEREAEDIRHTIRDTDVDVALRVASDIPSVHTLSAPRLAREVGRPLRVVFLSRISPMKNLLGALNVLAQVKVPVRFTIYGPVEDASYWNECSDRIASLPPNVEVAVRGPVHPRSVCLELSKHDLFFLPTAGENFGHVVVEALQAGLRVLISDQTPWTGLAEAGVGDALPLSDDQSFVQWIEREADRRSDPELAAKISAYLSVALDREKILLENRALFAERLSTQ